MYVGSWRSCGGWSRGLMLYSGTFPVCWGVRDSDLGFGQNGQKSTFWPHGLGGLVKGAEG